MQDNKINQISKAYFEYINFEEYILKYKQRKQITRRKEIK